MPTVLRPARALLRERATSRLLPASDSYITGRDVLRHLDGPTERQRLEDFYAARPVGTAYVMTENIHKGHATNLGWRHKRQTGQGVFAYRMNARERYITRWASRLGVDVRHLTVIPARERAAVADTLDIAASITRRWASDARHNKRTRTVVRSANAEKSRMRRAALKAAAMAASEAARQERMARQGMAIAALMRGETND